MTSIIYSGENFNSILQVFDHQNVQQIPEEELLALNREDTLFKEADLVIMDEHIKKPIKILQKIQKIDKNLSIILIRQNKDIEDFKLAIQFTPFIGNYIKIIASDKKNDILNLSEDLINQTKQRRSYSQLISATNKASLVGTTPDIHIAYLDKFLEAAPVGAILLNEKDCIIALNKFAQGLLEIKEAEAHKASIYKFFMSFELDRLNEFINTQGKNLVSRISNGKYVRVSISDIAGINKEFKILIMHDITARIEIEQQLHLKMHELERSNKELEQFAYIVSHDLKNPIASMLLTTELAAEENDMQEIKEHLQRLHKSSNQLMDIIKGLEEIIDVQKNLESHIKKINFDDVFNSVVYDYEKQLTKINATVTTDFSKVPSIDYIQPYLTSIFSNLISNSIKYRRLEVPLILNISTRLKDKHVILHFKDNGIGMNMDFSREDLFKPFRRFTQQATGKGIGLSIIKQMIGRNKGYIEVTSKEGVGTEFFCHLKPYNR